MRRYEVSDGQSSKYWEITLHGTGFTVRFGLVAIPEIVLSARIPRVYNWDKTRP